MPLGSGPSKALVNQGIQFASFILKLPRNEEAPFASLVNSSTRAGIL